MKSRDQTKAQLTDKSAETSEQTAGLKEPETEREQAGNVAQWNRAWLPTASMFVVLCVLVCLDEILDLPRLLLGAPATPLNWQEAIIEMALIAVVGLFTVSRLIRDITWRRQAEERERKALAAAAAAQMAIYTVEAMGDGLVLNTMDGKLTSINPAFERMTGYQQSELLGKNVADVAQKVVRPKDLEETSRAIKTALEGKTSVSTPPITLVSKEGRETPATFTVSFIRDTAGDPTAVIVVFRNITNLKWAEQSLRESEQWLSTTLRSIGDAVIATDAKGLVSLVNSVAEDLTGWDEAEAVGKPVEDVFNIINEKTGERSENPVARVLREGVVVGLANHAVLIAKDGTKRPIADSGATMRDEQGNIIGAVIVFRDITERKRAEEKLRKYRDHLEELVEERTHALRDLIESVPIGISISTPGVQGTVTDVNATLLQTFGYASKEEFLKVPASAHYYDPEEREPFSELCKLGPVKNYETRFKRKDGTVFWGSTTSTARTTKAGTTYFINTFEDITERRRAQEALQRRTEEIELLYKAGRQLGQTLNIETIYRRLYDWVVNSIDCDGLFISSYDPEKELIRCDFAITEGNQLDTSQFPPIPLEPEGQGTQSVVIRTGEPMLIRDYQARTETAATAYYVDEEGTVVGRDQVPRDKDVTRSALIIPVKLEGKVVGVIQVMSYMPNAYTESDMKIIESLASQVAVAGNNALLYQQAQDEIAQRKQVEEELREHRDHLEELVTARTAELDRRVAEVEQLNRGMSNLLEDLQAANQHVTRTARRLEQTNAELESFTYSVSHDLRAPLRHADSFAQLLLKREAARLEPTSARYLQNIVEATDKMGRLIDDLLALSRTGRAEMNLRPVAPNEIIEKAREELASVLVGRRIIWEIAPLPVVQADPGLLRIVWDNLLSNAVKYTGPRPEARIEIGATPPDEEGRVTFFIRDNGVGFDPQYTHKLFGTFQRLHRAEEFEGSGIGLATVRRIVNRHGGRVWAKGEPDRGATFYFTLSASKGD